MIELLLATNGFSDSSKGKGTNVILQEAELVCMRKTALGMSRERVPNHGLVVGNDLHT